VCALHSPPYANHQRWLAATYAGGEGSLLAGWAAAACMKLTETAPSVIEIVNESGQGRSATGIQVHRAWVERADRVLRHGIPCTSATRTVVDLARTIDQDLLEDLLLAADSIHALNRSRLEQLLADRDSQPGTRKLRELITDDPVEARTINERRMFSICREFGIPLPQVNMEIETAGRTFYADFCWPDLKLIVEADSWRWHGGRSASENDADRDQLLSMAGWMVVHFTRDQIKKKRAETGRRLLTLTGQSR
jgi:hypothetical protein